MAGKIAAACVSAIVLMGSGYAWYNYSSLNRNLHTVHVEGLGKSGRPSDAPAGPHGTGQDQNILLVGLDSREGLTEQQKKHLHVGSAPSTSTDTIVLVHLPADGRRATLVSIPRDSYVDIPVGGYLKNKINAAYADGYSDGTSPEDAQGRGASTLVATVKQLTGVSIDQYVQVGFAGFEKIVKAIGKIPVTLCADVDDTRRANIAENSDGGSGFKMTKGPHELDPQQALEFVRQRHNIPGPLTDDLGREERQRYFLRAAFDKIASAHTLLNPIRLQHLIAAIDDAFTFSDRNIDLAEFAGQMSQLTAGHISGQSIPTRGFETVDIQGVAQNVVRVDPPAVRASVAHLFYGTPLPGATAPHHPPTTHHSSSTSASPPSGSSSCIY